MFKHSSWKTTGLGISAILGAASFIIAELIDGGTNQKLDFGELSLAWSTLSAGVMGLFAKDKDKSNAPNPTEEPKPTAR